MKIKLDISGGDLFFISDFHLYHANVIKFDNRPFLTAEGLPEISSMHSTLLYNWNNTVDQNDIVFYLGDLSFGRMDKTKNFVDQLNGEIHFIMGNHDKYKDIVDLKRFASINDYVDLNLINAEDNNPHFVLMHYPIYSWNRQHHGSIMVHGHCHGNLHHGESREFYTNKRVIDVGCNLINYTPISYLEIIRRLNQTNNG